MSLCGPFAGWVIAGWSVLLGDERADLLGVVAEDAPPGPCGGASLVNGQLSGPAGGQLGVPTPRLVFSGFLATTSLPAGFAHSP